MIGFEEWPKTPRLFRDVVITEKIDGTNAAVVIKRHPFGTHAVDYSPHSIVLGTEMDEVGLPLYEYEVAAQSRKRLVTRDADNFGFAQWVAENAHELRLVLGEGRHFGEWWGSGIQRRYDMTEKRFSLFNTAKWSKIGRHDYCPRGLDVVPVLYCGEFTTEMVMVMLEQLSVYGSLAAPGFSRPEGVCVYHSASRSVYKATLDGDGAKGDV